MYLAIYLPDWNSIDSVRRVHSNLEAAALAFFALLVFFDVLAHFSSENKKRGNLLEKIALCCFAVAVLAEMAAYPYGQRNDTLTEQVIGSLDGKAIEAFTNASNALTKAGEADTKADAANRTSDQAKDKAEFALRQADDATTHLAKVTDAIRPQSLTLEEAKKLTDEFRPFARSRIPVKIITTEGPEMRLALMISYALKEAGFDQPSFEFRPAMYPGIEMGAPMRPLEYWQLMEKIEQPIVKRFGIKGPLATLPDGSPISIGVGPTFMGQIPEIPTRKSHK